MSMENQNLTNVVLFYLAKLLESGDIKMTLEQLQSDIRILNGLLDAIVQVFPSANQNKIITFLEEADTNPILQNIILLVVNNVLSSQPPVHQ